MNTTCQVKKMDPEAKQSWMQALRSGKYRQARGTLYNKNSNGFCCLGVARHAVDGKRGGATSLLHDNEYGLEKNVQKALAAANDCTFVKTAFKQIGLPPPKLDKHGRGATFKAIADWVEKYL